MPMYRKNDQPPRALPITFKEVPAIKKPGKKATEEEFKEYKKQIKEINLSTHFIDSLLRTRSSFDQAGYNNKEFIVVVDGSFCNRTCMGGKMDRTCVVARARKDAKLCFKATGGTQKVYDENKFTPKEVDLIPKN